MPELNPPDHSLDRALINEAVQAVGPALERPITTLQRELEKELSARGTGLPSSLVALLAERIAAGECPELRTRHS